MKKIVMILLLAMSSPMAQAAPNNCSAGPCADGTSCSVSGSTFASCNCKAPFTWPWEDAKPATAVCNSGIVIAPGGTLPGDLDPVEFDVAHLPNESLYYLQEIPSATPPPEGE